MPKRYLVDLTKDERDQRIALTRKGKADDDQAGAVRLVRIPVVVHYDRL